MCCIVVIKSRVKLEYLEISSGFVLVLAVDIVINYFALLVVVIMSQTVGGLQQLYKMLFLLASKVLLVICLE